jgi:lipopolysaccharide assembly outer membrane protein LptD (OstA)
MNKKEFRPGRKGKSMAQKQTIGYFSLSVLTAVSALALAGGDVPAAARQTRPKPFVPNPSSVRPIGRSQPPAVPSPAAKNPPPADPPVSTAASGDTKQKQAKIEIQFDPYLDQKTGFRSGRMITYTVDDMKVTGDKGRYNKNTKVLEADGNLVMDDAKHHVTGDKAHVDDSKKAKLAIITGHVVIVLKAKDDSQNTEDVQKEKSKGAVITCDRVDDYYKKEFVILTGHLVCKQKITKSDGHMVERTLTADHAEYDGKANKLHLFAPVDMKDTDDNKGHFDDDAFAGTKEGEETIESKGRFTGTFNVEEDKSDEETPPAGTPEKPASDKPISDKPADAKAGKPTEPPKE